MKKTLKAFLQRGLAFGGFGPIVLGIIAAVHQLIAGEPLAVDGIQLLLAIVSTYLLAFVQAGVSVFNQIESWSLPRSLLCHFGTLYVAYVLCYLVNSWIPFHPSVILVFTAVFVVTYFVIWLAVYLSVRAFERRCNEKLNKN